MTTAAHRHKVWGMPIEMKEQTALTALRDELRKIFEPLGARVAQFDIQMSERSLRWRRQTPHYPSHHVGGAFEEWRTSGRQDRQHRIVVLVVSDESLLDSENREQHAELFAGRWMPDRMSQPKITTLLNVFNIPLNDPIITVLPVRSIWNSR